MFSSVLATTPGHPHSQSLVSPEFAAALDPNATPEARDIARRARGRTLRLPTEDARVRRALRFAGEPICLFGEDAYDRRMRLREFLSGQPDPRINEVLAAVAARSGDQDSLEDVVTITKEFFTEGSDRLKEVRTALVSVTMARARERLAQEKAAKRPGDSVRASASRWRAQQRVSTIYVAASSAAAPRPLSACAFSPCSRVIAATGFGGHIAVMGTSDCAPVSTRQILSEDAMDTDDAPVEGMTIWRGHPGERVNDLAWRPLAQGEHYTSDTVCLASASDDGTVRLWSAGSAVEAGTLAGHTRRVTRASWHPSPGGVGGSHLLATASHDTSWRLWDVNYATSAGGDAGAVTGASITATGKELLLQEGHALEVHDVSWHPDGALLCSSGFDAWARLWDVRATRSAIMNLGGHSDRLTSGRFSLNGVQLATASLDHTIRVWDLRRPEDPISRVQLPRPGTPGMSHLRRLDHASPSLKSATVAAHPRPVARIAWEPVRHSFIASVGLDGCLALWGAPDWMALRAPPSSSLADSGGLAGLGINLGDHEGPVAGVDVSANAEIIATAGHDRILKLWRFRDDEKPRTAGR